MLLLWVLIYIVKMKNEEEKKDFIKSNILAKNEAIPEAIKKQLAKRCDLPSLGNNQKQIISTLFCF